MALIRLLFRELRGCTGHTSQEGVRALKRGSWEGKIRLMAMDNFDNLQHHVLFNLVEANPVGGLGKGVNEEVQRGSPIVIKINDKGLTSIDLYMVL